MRQLLQPKGDVSSEAIAEQRRSYTMSLLSPGIVKDCSLYNWKGSSSRKIRRCLLCCQTGKLSQRGLRTADSAAIWEVTQYRRAPIKLYFKPIPFKSYT